MYYYLLMLKLTVAPLLSELRKEHQLSCAKLVLLLLDCR